MYHNSIVSIAQILNNLASVPCVRSLQLQLQNVYQLIIKFHYFYRISFNLDILPACLPDPAEEFDVSKAKFTSNLRNDSNPMLKEPFDSPHVVRLLIQYYSSA